MDTKKSLLLIVLIVLFASTLVGFMVSRRSALQSTPSIETPSPTITPMLTSEEQCRKNILSDNNLYEDRMAKAVKTCADTQICTYEDFKMWSAANGSYVPDWRSEDYISIKVQECLETLPPPSPASNAGTLQ